MTRLSYPEVEGTLVKIQKNCSSLNSCEGDLVARKKKKKCHYMWNISQQALFWPTESDFSRGSGCPAGVP